MEHCEVLDLAPGAVIDPHNDDRIATAFTVAGLATGDQAVGQEGCVAKSCPGFWDELRAFG